MGPRRNIIEKKELYYILIKYHVSILLILQPKNGFLHFFTTYYVSFFIIHNFEIAENQRLVIYFVLIDCQFSKLHIFQIKKSLTHNLKNRHRREHS